MINLIGPFTIMFLFIEPSEITSPRGNDNTRVKINNLRVPKKPSSSDIVTVKNILTSFYC